MTVRKLLRRNEFYVLLTILAMSILIQYTSGMFFSGNNIVNILSASIVPGLLSLSIMVVLISGGIDVSFPAIASLAMYITTEFLLTQGFTGSVFWAFAMSGTIGLLLGCINGLIVCWLKVSPFIITLGTSSVFIGVLLGVLNSREINQLPQSMHDFGVSAIFVARHPETGMTSNLNPSILILIGFALILFFVLRYTMLGRSIYAVGGDEVAAQRAGFNINRTKLFVFAISGLIAGIAGITRVSMMRFLVPTNLLGIELITIAAVVLGGVSITGGEGTVKGALLGMLLITIVQNSMILIGIPTYWQSFFTGLFILIGIGVSSYQTLRSKQKLVSKFET